MEQTLRSSRRKISPRGFGYTRELLSPRHVFVEAVMNTEEPRKTTRSNNAKSTWFSIAQAIETNQVLLGNALVR
eukprot:scaffold22591_cov125-Cylindrotheca_fusiformis.AAC.4